MIRALLNSIAILSVTATSLGPCAAQMAAPAAPRGAVGSMPTTGPSQSAAGSYTLGAGDKVRVIVYGEEALTGEYNVTSAGDISFPLIGNVRAAGVSTIALQETIRARLAAGYLKDPRVSAEVLDYRPFFILGEVSKPGQYPYINGMTVQQAVATAGGFTYRANLKKVYVRHAEGGTEAVVNLRRGDPVAVSPGDTIRVAERFF